MTLRNEKLTFPPAQKLKCCKKMFRLLYENHPTEISRWRFFFAKFSKILKNFKKF